ncbi:MAG: hypothetical protein IPM98_02155 [Lewinellaceae bacterium]|nr:hypothetical protein [Lewinellaceae bacterium]
MGYTNSFVSVKVEILPLTRGEQKYIFKFNGRVAVLATGKNHSAQQRKKAMPE